MEKDPHHSQDEELKPEQVPLPDSETTEEAIPFEEEKIQDVNQPTSYKEVKTPGVNGKKLVTYELVSRNGAAPEKRIK